jgi:hypothetical protein
MPDTLPNTLPIEAYEARNISNSFNNPAFQTILNTLNNLIIAASQAGLYKITYTTGLLGQAVINQLTSLGYIVVDTSVTNNPPNVVYNYSISWTQLNWLPSGQPA